MGKFEMDEKLNLFFSNLNLLEDKDKIEIRRSFLKRYKELPLKTIISFTKVKVLDFKEEIWFFVASLYCYQLFKSDNRIEKEISLIFNNLNRDDNYDTLVKRLNTLLVSQHLPMDVCLLKLGQICKILNNDGYFINCYSLLKDLLQWDNEEQRVQKKWIKNIYSFKEDNENER